MHEVFVKKRGKLRHLWRAVDQDGDVIDILLQRRRNARAATRFLRKLLKGEHGHSAEIRHRQAAVNGQVTKLFVVGQHRLSAKNYRVF